MSRSQSTHICDLRSGERVGCTKDLNKDELREILRMYGYRGSRNLTRKELCRKIAHYQGKAAHTDVSCKKHQKSALQQLEDLRTSLQQYNQLNKQSKRIRTYTHDYVDSADVSDEVSSSVSEWF